MHQSLIARWEEDQHRLESSLARKSPRALYAQGLATASCQTVAGALPADSVLVEFLQFEVRDFEAVLARGQAPWKPAHYAAFILVAGKPEQPLVVDPGEARKLDRAVRVYKEAITGSPERGTRVAAGPGCFIRPPPLARRKRRNAASQIDSSRPYAPLPTRRCI